MLPLREMIPSIYFEVWNLPNMVLLAPAPAKASLSGPDPQAPRSTGLPTWYALRRLCKALAIHICIACYRVSYRILSYHYPDVWNCWSIFVLCLLFRATLRIKNGFSRSKPSRLQPLNPIFDLRKNVLDICWFLLWLPWQIWYQKPSDILPKTWNVVPNYWIW